MCSLISKIFQPISRKTDTIAMYRMVTIALLFLIFCSVVFGFLGLIPYSASEQIISLLVAVSVAFVSNIAFSKLLKVHVNNESALITALILFFLVLPAQLTNLSELWVIASVVFLAIVSKFLMVWRKQHIFNPAAFGVVIAVIIYESFPALNVYFESSWWIGQPALFIPLLIAGALVVFKIRRSALVFAFVATAFITFLVEEWRFGSDLLSVSPGFWLSGPTLFLAFFMLTEPFTTPPTKNLQIIYGILIGFLAETSIFSSIIKITPELALLIGNLVFYYATLKQKLILPLIEKREVAKNTFEFVFAKPKNISFKAGQYMEWMLPHTKSDNRGIRRYFTIASAPSDEHIRVGVRFGENISTYKTELQSMVVGETIIVSQLAGDFTLPKDSSKKVAMVAGGIGITPFVSQLNEMLQGGKKHDTVLFNCNNTEAEISYRDLLTKAEEKLPIKVINILAKEQVPNYEFGFLTEEIIKRQAPDYLERTWYISGPPMMVGSYTKLLKSMGVPSKQIVTDFFPGLA
ncbi:MAG: RnfABCDGE type electron transport complex subunit D [Candidatus Pacebacteria bacterium]|nr:RnfABCDGE type electron transport complex subunit D [Candidatus Paceibacterota bacterium]